MKKKLYFGHPINVYGTDLQRALLARIAERFPDWEIENPDQPHHDEGYRRRKEATGRPMDYYTQEVLPGCGGGVFLTFRDGMFGAGVFAEAVAIHGQGGPVWEIDAEGRVSALLLDGRRALSVDETRSRIRLPGGGGLKPY